MFYWLMKRVFAGPWLKLFFRPWTRGVENVPAEGGAILASNHLAVIDSFVLPLVLALPSAFGLAPLVVVTQTLVELVVMVVFVRLVPRVIGGR